jgi:uncharacterized protein
MRLDHVHPLTAEGEPTLADARPDRVLAGSGVAKVWNAFTGEDGRFSAGIWQAQPGVLAVDYTETELCVLLEGRVRLSSDAGSVEFEEGDAFVIAAGFKGSWESVGRVTKAYAVLEPPPG